MLKWHYKEMKKKDKNIKFSDIHSVVAEALEAQDGHMIHSMEDIFEVDLAARERVRNILTQRT